MAINTIEYSTNMMTQLDQQAAIELTTGWMESNAGQVIYNGGAEVKIPTMSTDGLGDYDRDGGFAQGSISLTYETYRMTQDRGRTFQLDSMDVNESNFVATSANVIKTFQSEQVFAEIDSYRYSKIYSIAKEAGQSEAINLTAANAFTKLKEHIRAVEDVLGVGSKLILTMPSSTLALIEDSEKFAKFINVAEFEQGGIKTTVKSIDGHIIKVVPSARLKTEYEVQDGRTAGQEAGGLKASATAKDINYIITPASVPIAISKTDKLRVFTPDQNQKADAWKIDYRKYHDLWIKKNKKNQIFVSTTA